MARKKQPDTKKAQQLADHAVALAEYAEGTRRRDEDQADITPDGRNQEAGVVRHPVTP